VSEGYPRGRLTEVQRWPVRLSPHLRRDDGVTRSYCRPVRGINVSPKVDCVLISANTASDRHFSEYPISQDLARFPENLS
jgi:hypothetical protein